MGLVVRVVCRVVRMAATQEAFQCCNLIALVVVRVPVWLINSRRRRQVCR